MILLAIGPGLVAQFANTDAFLHHPAESMASTGIGFGAPAKA